MRALGRTHDDDLVSGCDDLAHGWRMAGARSRHSATVGCGCKTSVREWQGHPAPGSSASSALNPLDTTVVTDEPSSAPRHMAA